VRETIAFYKTQTPERQSALRAGLTPEREKEVLAVWHAKPRP
jgi:2'-hydroxyisoflavone reductase